MASALEAALDRENFSASLALRKRECVDFVHSSRREAFGTRLFRLLFP
jgi:hypothetical protein